MTNPTITVHNRQGRVRGDELEIKSKKIPYIRLIWLSEINKRWDIVIMPDLCYYLT